MAVDLNFLLGNDSLFDIVLPFVLIFTIVFAIMQSTKILGGKKNIDAIIALVFGFLLIRNGVVVSTINRFLPNVALLIVVLLMILLVVGVFVGEDYGWSSGMKGLAAVLAVIVVLWIFGESYWSRYGIPNIFAGLSSETKGVLTFLAVLIIIVFFVTREGKDKPAGETFKNFGDAIFKK
ncbi:MAG: hypothetical protein ABIB47_05925 [Candidatus Woesearchaeota archaeon]